MRYLIVVRSSLGHNGRRIASALGCCVSTFSRVLFRYQALGEAGLVDRREDNGQPKASDLYAQTVRWLLEGSPQDYFHGSTKLIEVPRPTWTKALLILTAKRYTHVAVSKSTNHRCPSIERVCEEVVGYLMKHYRAPPPNQMLENRGGLFKYECQEYVWNASYLAKKVNTVVSLSGAPGLTTIDGKLG